MARPRSHELAEIQLLCRERDTLRAQRDSLLTVLEAICAELEDGDYTSAEQIAHHAGADVIAAVKQEGE